MKKILKEAIVLQRNVPGIVLALFIVSVTAMNLLANKSINLPFTWLALDCGIVFSWVVFLLMDMVTKHYGAKAATMLSIMALVLNFLIVFLLFVGAGIPGMWSSAYVEGSEDVINAALDEVFAGTWYVVMGSSIAFIISAFVNNYLNAFIGKHMDDGSFGTFAVRSYVSTFVGQFCDNLAFALIVSLHFFGWTALQCVTCALTGAVCELLCEVVFSPIGYRISHIWKKQDVGREYLEVYGGR